MALTPSTMVSLGSKAPEFSLPDAVSGEVVSLSDVKSDVANLIMFICNHCPYVKHIQDELAKLGKDYSEKGVNVVAISSNDVINYPEDSPEKMKMVASQVGYTFPYLYDETQEVARQYDAACTPDFFLYDGSLELVYRGQLDESRPENGKPVTGKDLRVALDAVIAGDKVSPDQKPSMGCNIKWR